MASKVPSMATKAKYLAEFNDSKDVPFAYQGTSSKVFCKYCEPRCSRKMWVFRCSKRPTVCCRAKLGLRFLRA